MEPLATAAAAAASATSSAAPIYEQKLQYLFEPKYVDFKAAQSVRQSLDRLTGITSATGLVITTPAGADLLMTNTIVDSGADTAIVTEELCKRIGLHIYRNEPPFYFIEAV